MSLTSAQKAEIQALVAAGQKIEAVKRFREITGVGLKEALQAVTGIGGGRGTAAPHGTHAPLGSAREATAQINPKTRVQAEAAALAALRDGNMIEAIKRYRDQAKVGLQEAKDAVDALSVVHSSEGRVNAKLARALIELMAAGKKDEALSLLMSNVGYDDSDARAFLKKLSSFRRGPGGGPGCGGCGGGCLRGILNLLLLAAVAIALLQGGCSLLVRNSSLFRCVEPKVLSSSAKNRLGEPLTLSPWMFVANAEGAADNFTGDTAAFKGYGRLSGPLGTRSVVIDATRQKGQASASVILDPLGLDEIVFSGSFACPVN